MFYGSSHINDASFSKYPFSAVSTMRADDGRVLGDDVVVDAVMYVPAGVVPRLSSIGADSGVSVSDGRSEIAHGKIEEGEAVLLDRNGKTVGCIVVGDGIGSIGPKMSFKPDAAIFSCDAFFPVSGTGVSSVDFGGGRLDGTVELAGSGTDGSSIAHTWSGRIEPMIDEGNVLRFHVMDRESRYDSYSINTVTVATESGSPFNIYPIEGESGTSGCYVWLIDVTTDVVKARKTASEHVYEAAGCNVCGGIPDPGERGKSPYSWGVTTFARRNGGRVQIIGKDPTAVGAVSRNALRIRTVTSGATASPMSSGASAGSSRDASKPVRVGSGIVVEIPGA